ncbi:hypothetical protein [Rhizobium sp. LjRoot258]|uniref:hypothetical protein n=1 Tax=Rhizobium sp. LjRoot258 TaxID=3342299 RepID=UPI003ECC93E9
MNERMSKSRERAEAAFGLTQTQFLTRTRESPKIDQVVTARNEKTARLRAMRLQQEANTAIETPSRANPIND